MNIGIILNIVRSSVAFKYSNKNEYFTILLISYRHIIGRSGIYTCSILSFCTKLSYIQKREIADGVV